MILVPGASGILVAFDWREAYWFLGLLLLGLVLPAGYLLIRNRPEELGDGAAVPRPERVNEAIHGLDVGPLVVRGILEDRTYIFTSEDARSRVETRSEPFGDRSGCVGGGPRTPKSPEVSTNPRPKNSCHIRLTATRAVNG